MNEECTVHMKALMSQTIEEVQMFIKKRYEESLTREKEFGQPKSYIAKLLWWDPKKKISKTIYNIVHHKEVMAEAYQFCYDYYRKKEYIESFHGIHNSFDKYDLVYSLLEDEDSKKLYEYLIKSRIAYTFIGEEVCELYPLSMISILKSNEPDGNRPKRIKTNTYKVENYTIETTREVIDGTWYEGQYHYKDLCMPAIGDVALSCGAFMGETAIWLADKVGVNGKVYAFEPTKNIYQKLIQNISNNNLDHCVKAINYGLWNEDTVLRLKTSSALEVNACNSVINKDGDIEVEVRRIDSFVLEEDIHKVDYIKMDIEGAERFALRGAEQVIKKYKPKLAICVYHLSDDIIEIASYIHLIVPEYQLYLSQKNSYEVVLFACINQ